MELWDRLIHYRKEEVTAERIVGLLAEWCGCGRRHEMSAANFLSQLNLERLPTEPIVFTKEDDA